MIVLIKVAGNLVNLDQVARVERLGDDERVRVHLAGAVPYLDLTPRQGEALMEEIWDLFTARQIVLRDAAVPEDDPRLCDDGGNRNEPLREQAHRAGPRAVEARQGDAGAGEPPAGVGAVRKRPARRNAAAPARAAG